MAAGPTNLTHNYLIPANTSTTTVVSGVIKQDLSDVIEMLSQEDTPYQSNIGRGKAKATLHEWNVDQLAPVAENAWGEGEEAWADDRPVTKRLQDYTQIMRKVVSVSGTLQSIDVIGGKTQLARELMKAGRELKLDREKRLVGISPASAGADATGGNEVPPAHLGTDPATAATGNARYMAGLGCFLVTNVSRGVGGANPTFSGAGNSGYPSVAPVLGTPRAFAESQLKAIMQSAYANGGKPKMMMVPPNLKVQASAFTGIANQRYNVPVGSDLTATVIGAVDVYQSDFGKLSFVPNPQMRNDMAYFIDAEYAELMPLRAIDTQTLAKTGDSEKRLMIWEGTHKVNNEAAHGAVFDLTP